MRNVYQRTLALVLGLGMSLACSGSRADDEKIALDKVPKAVLDAVKAKYPGASLREAEKDVDDGKTFYEISITHKAHAIVVVTQPDGAVVAVEKTLTVAEVPASVSKAIKAKYPKAQIKNAEEIEEDGKTTYEIVIEKTPGKNAGLVLDSAGKILDESE